MHNKQLFNNTGILFEICNQKPTQLKELSTIQLGEKTKNNASFKMFSVFFIIINIIIPVKLIILNCKFSFILIVVFIIFIVTYLLNFIFLIYSFVKNYKNMIMLYYIEKLNA